MARQGYVYSSRQKKRKSLIFFILSLVTIIVLYIIVRQIFGTDAEPVDAPTPAETPVVRTEQPTPPSQPKRDTPKPDTEPRAVVKPAQQPIETAKKPQLPAGVIVEDVVTGAAKETADPVKPVKTEEDILAEDIEKATNVARKGEIIEARDALLTLMRRNPDSPQRLKIKNLLSSLADQWLFSDKVLEGDDLCSIYEVKRGDFLSRIGASYDVPWEFLLKINKITRPEALRQGQKIKVVQGPFNAVISRSSFTMDLYLDDIYIKSYKVGLGSTKHETPTGLWTVGTDKLVAPSWTDPDSGRVYDATDPDYPLGKRWVGLKGVAGDALGRTGFALHGTNEPQSIGQRSSRGCIRLADEDILEVYDLMVPNKSQVQIVD